MPRVKRGVTARARPKKILAPSQGFRGGRGKVFSIAQKPAVKARRYGSRERRTKKTR